MEFERGDMLRVDHPNTGKLVVYLEPRKEGGDFVMDRKGRCWIESERLSHIGDVIKEKRSESADMMTPVECVVLECLRAVQRRFWTRKNEKEAEVWWFIHNAEGHWLQAIIDERRRESA